MSNSEATAPQILAGLPPTSPDELRRAAHHGGVREMKWALSHRGAFQDDKETPREVCEQAVLLVVGSNARTLAELAGAFHSHWPEGLLDPRVVCAVHLALEGESLGPRELFLLLQPLLAEDARFDAFVRHGEQRALGGRLRVAELALGVALAATFAGRLANVLAGDRRDAFERVVERLYKDRDAGVGLRAAWAAGALASRSPRLERLVAGGREDGDERERSTSGDDAKARAPVKAPQKLVGLAARRQMIARTARFILGEDDDDDAYLADLRTGIGKTDVFVRWSAISAMQLGVRIAPDTTADVVRSLIPGSSPEVLAAAAGFARAHGDAAMRDELLRAVTAEAAARGDADGGALRFVLGPRARTATTLLRGHDALVAALKESPRAAGDASESLLADVRAAVTSLGLAEEGETNDIDDVDQALDKVLFDTPILRDALRASAENDEDREGRDRAWAQAVSALASPRLARCEEAGEGAGDLTTQRDRLRRLGRALDGQPHDDRVAGDERAAFATAFLATCRKVARSLLARHDGKGALDRPIAVALAAAVEPLVAHDRLQPADIVGAMLATPAGGKSLARHLAVSVSHGGLSRALASLAAFSAAKADDFASSAHALAKDLSALGAEHPAAVAARALDVAIAATVSAARGAQGAPLVGLWLTAIEAVDRADLSAGEVFGRAPRASTPLLGVSAAPPVERAVYSLLASEKLMPVLAAERPFGAARAKSVLARALPPLFAGLFDPLVGAVYAAARAATEAKAGAAFAGRGGGIAPGKRIGDYVVERVLGSGGMGHCVLVRRRLEADQKNARQWVLKIPQRAEYVEAFRNEALALLFVAKAGHPAIVRFVSYVDYGFRLPFLVMEYVAGDALDKRMERGPMTAPDVRALGARLADGIAKSHAMSVCHHDIKPGNIVLEGAGAGARGAAPASSEPRPVLVDWGLAGAAYPWAGTPEYMAPERFDFARGKTAQAGVQPSAADVWALGCVLVEMLSGAPLVCEPLTEKDVGEHRQILDAYRSLDPQFKRSYACEAIAKNAPLLGARLDRALAGVSGGSDAAALKTTLRAMVDVRAAARPQAAEVARLLGDGGSGSARGGA